MNDQLIKQLIRELRHERDEIDYVIRTLETLSTGKRRRGRPPKLLSGLANLGEGSRVAGLKSSRRG